MNVRNLVQIGPTILQKLFTLFDVDFLSRKVCDFFVFFVSIAKKGERYSKQLDDELDDEERLKIVEKLGDLYSEAKASEKALFYYQQQVFVCIENCWKD